MRRHNVWYRWAGRHFRSMGLIAGLSMIGLGGCHSVSHKDGTSMELARSMPQARSMPVNAIASPWVATPAGLASLPPVPIRTAEYMLEQSDRESGQGIRLVSAIFPLLGDSQPKPAVSTSISDSPMIAPVLHRVDWTAVLAAARELEANGKLPEAIQSYQSFEGQADAPAAVFHRLGVLYDKTGQEDLAVPMFKRALALDPNNADLLCDLGYRRQTMGDTMTANHYYQKALAVDSQHARTHNHLAVMLLSNGGDEELAMEHFRKAGLSWFHAKQNIRYLHASRKAEK